ncbi:putative reverse transcriptase domain-containing protein, partial [Tanacetum coccineum]
AVKIYQEWDPTVITRNENKMLSKIIRYPSGYDEYEKIRIGYAYNLKFSCMIGFELVQANFFPNLDINVMSKKFYNSIIKDKIEFRGRNELGNFANVPDFIGNCYVIIDFTVVEDMDPYLNEGMGEVDLAGKEIDNVDEVSIIWNSLIMEYLVKISKKARILELKQRHLKITVLTSYMPLLRSVASIMDFRNANHYTDPLTLLLSMKGFARENFYVEGCGDSVTSEEYSADLDIKFLKRALVLANSQMIITVNVIPPNHVDDVPVVEPNQHDDVPVVPKPVLVDEGEDLEEDEFEEEEDPQEEEHDMEVNIEEDENEPELTYPYEEVDPLNPLLSASESEPDDAIEVENPIEHEDETLPASVYEVGESSTAAIPREDGDSLLPGFMRRDIDSLFGRKVNFQDNLRSSVEQGMAAMEKLVEKLGNAGDKVECKKLKKELEEARFSNTFLYMQNERVERVLYWTRVQAHEFYQEMIRRGFVFEERPNKAINVPIEDEKSPSSESIMPSKSALMTQATIRRMIKKSVDATIAAERARQANVRNDASGSGPVKGLDNAPAVRKCTFAGLMMCNPAVFHEGKKVKFAAATLEGPALTWWKTKVATMGLETVNQMPWTEIKQLMTAEFCPIEEVQRMEHELWNLKVKEYDVVAYSQRFNELALMCPRMVEPERVKVDAYIWGLTDNIKGEVTSSKPADLNKAVRMAHKLMEQKSQARDARILEGKKQKWENLQRGISSGKGNQMDNSR